MESKRNETALTPHALDGDWQSLVINTGTGSLIPESVITLKITGEDLDKGSKRKREGGTEHEMSGKVKFDGKRHDLKIGDTVTDYEGKTLLEIDLGTGKKIIVIGGRKINKPGPLLAQEEGTWVAVKQG